jgi:hypothetical protein
MVSNLRRSPRRRARTGPPETVARAYFGPHEFLLASLNFTSLDGCADCRRDGLIGVVGGLCARRGRLQE